MLTNVDEKNSLQKYIEYSRGTSALLHYWIVGYTTIEVSKLYHIVVGFLLLCHIMMLKKSATIFWVGSDSQPMRWKRWMWLSNDMAFFHRPMRRHQSCIQECAFLHTLNYSHLMTCGYYNNAITKATS